MVLNENNERFTIFVKKRVQSTSPRNSLLEPFRLDLNFKFAPYKNKENANAVNKKFDYFWADEIIEAIWKKTRDHEPQKMTIGNQSSLISVDRNCSILSLNFTSESFYQSQSREDCPESVLPSEVNRNMSPKIAEKRDWLRRYQIEFGDNQTIVKRALRVAPLWVVGKGRKGKLFYR